jgi:hypothetical protein
MRHTGILSLAACLSLIGCGAPSSPETDAKISNAKDKGRDAAEATTEAARAKRDEYAREMKKRLDVLNVKYEELEARAAQAEG